jgi:hypothetical protein
MSTMTATGAAPITNRRALVETLASMAALHAMMAATAANQPPRSHVGEILFNMISTLSFRSALTEW